MKEKKEFEGRLLKLRKMAQNDGPVTVNKIKELFSDWDLNEEQAAMVLRYLEGEAPEGEHEAGEREESEMVSRSFSRYLDSLNRMERPDRALAEKCFGGLAEGREEARETLLNYFLKEVADIAKSCGSRCGNAEDLIQEGNAGLLLAFEEAKEIRDFERFEEFVKGKVREEMERYLDREMEGEDRLDTLLAKMNLVLEASRRLAEELGRRPEAGELSEYTRMPEEEIEALLGLTKEAGNIIYG